jgi:hypothetical protein
MIKKMFGGIVSAIPVSAYNTTADIPREFGIGLSSQVISDSDTGCVTKIPITPHTLDACEVITGWIQSEYGGPVEENNNDYLTGSGCLNLPTDYSVGYASWTKTITSVNLSATGACVYMFLYISDIKYLLAGTDTVSILLGDGTNFNGYNFPSTALTVGTWFPLSITDLTDFDSHTGGAVATNLAAITNIKLRLRINTEDAIGNALMMDNWVYALNDDFLKTVEAAYPVMSVTKHHVVFQSKLTSTEANGFTILEHALTNPSLMPFNRSTFAGIIKTSDKEVRFTNTIRFTNL